MDTRHMLFTLLLTSSAILCRADEFAASEVLVRFKDTATTQEIAVFEKSEPLTFLNEIQTINVRLYQLPQGVDVEAAVVRFSQNPIVDFAEPNYARTLSAVNDPAYPKQWSLNNTGQQVNGVSGPAGIDIRWPQAMALFRGQTPVAVAVIDSGVALDHDDMLGNAWGSTCELYGATGADDDGNGYIDDIVGWDFYAQDIIPLDENGHGTLVASIIAGLSNNGIGGTGICPTAEIMALRVLDQFGRAGIPKFARVSDVALALDYALRNGARIVNLSLGGTSFSATEYWMLQALSSGGVLVVAAAGNGGYDGSGDNNDISPLYPASYNVSNIIAVAAQNRSGALAYFSNYGPTRVHIAAPGTDIYGVDITRRTFYSENFEGLVSGWVVGSLPGSLATQPWSIGTSGENSFLQDHLLGVPYVPDTNTWVRSPLINLTGAHGTRLSFNLAYDLADDWLWVEASADGSTWLPYDFIYGSSLLGQVIYQRDVDLSDFDGGYVYFRFRLFSDYSVQGYGVIIDNVSLSYVTIFDPSAPLFKFGDGTSFAAPMVSGVAALIISQRPDLSASQVRSIILGSARRLSALTGKVTTGGMLDAQSALQFANAAPSSAAQPTSFSTTQGGQISFSVQAGGSSPFSYQWFRNGTAVSGATNATLTINNVQPTSTGVYSAIVTNSVAGVVSEPSILGIASTSKVIGAGTEILSNQFVAFNNNTFDQVALQGAAATITADPRQITRMSFVDLTDDIVQVEFSGAGALSLVLDNLSGPATAANYNQPTVTYMKGHVGIVITGANETTNVGVFSVGRITAVNQTLFKSNVTYDGLADLAYIAIQSTNGKFGGVRTANANYYATKGLTGIYAPDVQFTGPVFVGDLNAFDAAIPVLMIGSSPDTRITGGNLLQANGQPVRVSGLTQLKFTAGTTSHGVNLSAQNNKARLRQNGIDVTNQIVVIP